MAGNPGDLFVKAGSLLGKQVKVQLWSKHVVVEGRLLSFDDAGGFVIEDAESHVHHCWPMLDIEAVNRG